MLIHNRINNWIEHGRLGNIMFQIASCMGIAYENHTTFGSFDPWCYQGHFDTIIPRVGFTGNTPIGDSLPYYHYAPIHLDVFRNYWCNGYFQSEKYFKNIIPQIKSMFTLKKDQEEYQKTLHAQHLDKIAMHVRRTDYVGNGATPALPMEYYWEAIEHFPNEKFLICSDDINFCKQTFTGDRFSFIDNGQIDIHDMYLMSYCKGIIGANSSFSWWSAWLGERPGYKIIFPKAWFGGWMSKDIIPDRWERVGTPFHGGEI